MPNKLKNEIMEHTFSKPTKMCFLGHLKQCVCCKAFHGCSGQRHFLQKKRKTTQQNPLDKDTKFP